MKTIKYYKHQKLTYVKFVKPNIFSRHRFNKNDLTQNRQFFNG